MERYLERHDLVQDGEEDEEEDDLEEGAIIGEFLHENRRMRTIM